MPGSRADKWLSAKWCIPAFFIVSFITTAGLHLYWILIPWLMLIAFAAGMLFALGPRVAIVGILSLIIASFTIGLWPASALSYSCWIVAGAGWYFVISLLLVYYAPYRSLKHALKRSTDGIAALLKTKALFYNADTLVEKAYEDLSALHIVVSEQQDQVRLLLLREHNLLQKENKVGQQWLQQLYGTIDLYEVLTAIDHDYDTIRNSLTESGALELVRKIIILLADRVQMISENDNSFSMQANEQEIQRQISQLNEINANIRPESVEVLSATIANIREILEKVDRLYSIANKGANLNDRPQDIDYTHFIPASSVSWGRY
ncbi:YccS/YhfK family membrane protein [Niabella hibiscisoli]|uniref:YccS/YhfK family membrane protein n=1 Tax=Niabella hibiscisoli TaxID=1825928 RepID=UPI001F108D68|nr:YccS/YhfK family membrane protein [Niabella hibiscisoli]MCH5719597.1 YccS/YhfK family membrane protein [Niabella hibiscisoli]